MLPMEDNLAALFIEPYTLNGRSLDFVVNDHFFGDLSFEQFDPVTNGYLTGFFLSILCTIVKQQVTTSNGVQYRIDDVLFGALNSNLGIKSAAIVENATSGKKIMLIQNFYFVNSTSKLKNNRGLSKSERRKVRTILGDKFEEKTAEFLIYRINVDAFDNFVCNRSKKSVRIYMESITTDIPESAETAENEVEKFVKVNNCVDTKQHLAGMFNKKNDAIISVIIEKASNLLYKITNNSSEPLKLSGFIHGILFTSCSMHKHILKVSIFDQKYPAIRFSLEPLITLKNSHNLSRPFSFDFSPNNKVVSKPIGNFLARLIEVAATSNMELMVEKIMLEMTTNLIGQLLLSDKMHTKYYVETFLFGMLYTQQAKISDVSMSNRKNPLASQLIFQLLGKQRIIVFNFDRTVQVSIDGLKLKNFAYGRPTTHVFVISIFETETGCNRDLSIKDLTYDISVTVLKPSLKKYPRNSNHHLNVEKNNFLTSLLDLDKGHAYGFVAVYQEFIKILLKTIDFRKGDIKKFEYFLEGALHHLKHLANNHEPPIRVDMFYSKAAYSVRLESGDMITLINFVNAGFSKQFATYFRENRMLRDLNYNVLTFLYDYDQATNILVSYVLLRNQADINNNHFSANDTDIFLVSTCFHCENKTLAVCPKSIIKANSRDILPEENKILPASYRVYVKFLNLIYDLTSDENVSQSVKNKRGRRTEGGLMAKFQPIIHYLPVPRYSFLDYFSSGLMVHSTFDFVDSIKSQKLSKKIFKFMLKGYKILNDKLLPGINILLSADALRNAVEAYADGDKSPYAIFNIFSAATSLTLSVTSVVLAYLQIGASVIPVIGWVVSAILYAISAIWNADIIMEQVNAVVQLPPLENFQQRTRLFFLLGLSHELMKDLGDKPLNEQILTNILTVMKKNHNIKHYITSASCFNEDRYRPCRDIYVDLRQKYIFDETLITTRSAPKLSTEDAKYNEQLCDLTRITSRWRADEQHELKWLPSYGTHPIRLLDSPFETFHDESNTSSIPVGHKVSYACNNAIGISSLQFERNVESQYISLYNFVGDAQVYAKPDTTNVILLSRGRYCSIIGGDRSNFFHFTTIYNICYLEGDDVARNVVDLSGLVESPIIYTMSTHYIKLEYSKWTIDRSSKQLSSGYIYLKNIDSFVLSHKKEPDFVNINCLVGNIDLQRKARCTSLYLINVDDPTDSCKMHVMINSEGCIHIENNALSGKFLYAFHGMTGDVRINLKHGKNITHRIELAFVEITKTKNLMLRRDKRNAHIKFTHQEWTFHVVVEWSAESLQLSFGDGVEIRYKDNRFFTEIISENPISRMWYDYKSLFDTFNQSDIECRAYSEWNDETLLLKHKYMRVERTGRQFKASSKFENRQLLFAEGYNVHLVMPDKCQLRKISHVPLNWLFLDREVVVTGAIDALIIDLSLVQESLKIVNKLGRLDVNLKIVGNSINLEVNTHIQYEDVLISFRAGIIRLPFIMYNNRWKSVRILTESEFVLEKNWYGKLEIKPVQKIVDPLNPVVILDTHTVEYGQTIFFKDRVLINYDLVRVTESILVVTNLASNMMKGFLLNAETVPFLTVVIKQYTHEKMRSLKLKFDEGTQFDLDKLDEKRMISLTDFKSKIETFNERMKQKPFIFRHDSRYDADEIQTRLWH